MTPAIGSSIHLHSRKGIYVVLDIEHEHIVITCKKWIQEHKRGERKSDRICVPHKDYKCPKGKINKGVNSNGYEGEIINTGLTKREYFAALAMQGNISTFSNQGNIASVETVAKWSVEMADALINALNAEK